ncbi:hypothetical protein GCM10027275_29350 [Rhabdobacter roseus]|uniref:DUF4249 domain-containing protein n=1 Tax=Rhabdobacter roseus TaxID=1655419 RepID=A0A840TYC7_9BACT|nr:DUF4249 domain-containing protein [Rhabdobacter roseus]MBB5284890.1 hypothetical protein [Rhabdobacter roseus]
MTKRYKYLSIITLLLAGVGVLSCIDPVGLPIRQVEPRLVVEGLITNEPPPYVIRLSYSGAFSSTNPTPDELVVQGARVTIAEEGGRTVTLEQDPLTPTYYWMRDTTFRGQVGRRYALRVELPDGTRYVTAPELLAEVPPIERLYAEFRQQPEGSREPDHYQVLLDTNDPPVRGNYYRWSGYGYVPHRSTGERLGFAGICCNWCWIPIYAPPTNVLSDALVNGNRLSRVPVLSSPIYTVGRHYLEIRQYSLSREAYQFWRRFEEQRQRTGSLFDPQPASIEGNLHREDQPERIALGYFGASAVSKARLEVPGDTLSVHRYQLRYGDLFTPEGNCLRLFPQSRLSPPSPW